MRREDVISPVYDRLFNSFVEHMGRVHMGIYESGHPTTDVGGFREDVAALNRPLDLPLIRYPGTTSSPATGWRTALAPERSVPSSGGTWPG